MLNTVHHANDGTIALATLLDLTAAEPLHRILLERARTGDQVVVSGAAVERISTAVIQVLLAGASDARSRGTVFQLCDPSPTLLEALADLGVTADLGS